MRDSRVHNYPPRWNAAPRQDLLVIRRNHDTGEISLDPVRWGLIPYWCKDAKGGRKPINAKCGTCRPSGTLTASGAASCPWKGQKSQAALCHCHEGRRALLSGGRWRFSMPVARFEPDLLSAWM